jgi:hypothetical protein
MNDIKFDDCKVETLSIHIHGLRGFTHFSEKHSHSDVLSLLKRMGKLLFRLLIGTAFSFNLIQLVSAQTISFENQIFPILQNKCSECHGDENPEVRLTVVNYEQLMQGSEFGIVVNPGDPVTSYMIEMIALGEMPQDGEPVTDQELSLIKTWIEEGALNN